MLYGYNLAVVNSPAIVRDRQLQMINALAKLSDLVVVYDLRVAGSNSWSGQRPPA